MLPRKSGILLHITSLPSDFGIGDLGPCARKFIDFLIDAKQSYWQVLPVNPTESINHHSPYSSSSAFAGNILLISPEQLYLDGFLTDKECDAGIVKGRAKVDFSKAIVTKTRMLDLAYDRFKTDRKLNKAVKGQFFQFKEENDFWLRDYALFRSIKAQNDDKIWTDWPVPLRDREKGAIGKFSIKHGQAIEKIAFGQFLFFKQMNPLKSYARQKGISLIGDVPIYVNFDGADVWAEPQNYQLDEQYRPIFVSGVPPDYFSKTGQIWGNPIYDWGRFESNGFDWWVKRFEHNFRHFDLLRVDHFRGLVQYWEIPSGAPTALHGRWANVPTVALFETLERRFTKPLAIIAEDLGYITDDVREMARRFDLPGMKVLQFAFGEDLKTHPYLPHNYDDRCVVYTGTHDNNTTLGWFRAEASDLERKQLNEYFGKEISETNVCWEMIRLAMGSKAQLVIIPMQDVLGLGSSSRMNKPATTQDNWTWQLGQESLDRDHSQKLSEATRIARRT